MRNAVRKKEINSDARQKQAVESRSLRMPGLTREEEGGECSDGAQIVAESFDVVFICLSLNSRQLEEEKINRMFGGKGEMKRLMQTAKDRKGR